MILRALALVLLVLAPGAAAPIRVDVFHTNDIHGGIMPSAAKSGRMTGGAAAMAAAYRAHRGPKILLDAGDWFQGTPEGSLTRGRVLAEIFNAVPYDAVAIGNHEYDFGEAELVKLVKSVKIPVLAANIYRDGARVPYVSPWIVKEVAGVKIGVFGLLTALMKEKTFPRFIEGLEFRREIEEAKDAVAALRAKGATVVIAVTHIGLESPRSAPFEGDKTLANEVEGIDLIVGGHTHIPLPRPIHDAAHGTRIVQAGTALAKLGRVTLIIDERTKRVVEIQGRLLDLDPGRVGEAADVRAIVERAAKAMDRSLSEPIASAARALERGKGGESDVGNWLTDCLRGWAETDVAFQNSRGIRAGLPAGAVTLRGIFHVMPFENRVVKLRMKGRLIRQVLEKGAAGSAPAIQFSGLKVFYNRGRPAGERVEEAWVGNRPLDADASYSVAAPDFMVEGSGGYTPFAAASETVSTPTLLRDVLGLCARERPRIEPPPRGRMVFRES